MSPIESNLQLVRGVIDAAKRGLPRGVDHPVRLVAVSKQKPAADVRAALAAGQADFGENYVQEGVAKIAALADVRDRLTWHFIGPLQSNKAKLVATHFDWVHGIDRLKIADALSTHRAGMPPLDACVQVNVSGEASKHGVPPGDALALAEAVSARTGLKLRGLMAIVEDTDDEQRLRGQFRIMRELFEALAARRPGVDTLSMGMSQDYAVAIEEGATLVRIGSAIFGARADKGV